MIKQLIYCAMCRKAFTGSHACIRVTPPITIMAEIYPKTRYTRDRCRWPPFRRDA